jgi:hypothetical protein
MLQDLPLIFWLPYVSLVIHTVEELPGFAAWATRHFNPMTTHKHAIIQVFMILLLLVASYKASVAGYNGGWVVLAAAFQVHIGLNALFHVATTVIFQEYSPGMLTAVTVSIPATLFFFMHVCQDHRLTGIELTIALILGTAIAAAAVGTLFLKSQKKEKTQ